MKELDAVKRAIGEINFLVADLESDLSEAGGFCWWTNYRFGNDDQQNDEIRIDLSDYLIDVTTAVGTNLESAAVFLGDYKAKKFSQDFARRERIRQGGDYASFHEGEDGRQKVLTAYAAGFIATISAALDTLAGVVVGVAGLKTSLVKSDMRWFSPFLEGDGYFRTSRLNPKLASPGPGREAQEGLIGALRSSVHHAGPLGWEVWADDLRNATMHRGGHLHLTAVHRKNKSTPWAFPVLPVAEPSLTTVQNMRAHPGEGLKDVYIFEDSADVMTGLLDAVAATVIGTFVAANALWQIRKADPTLIIQPGQQAHRPKTPSGFRGFAPDDSLGDSITSIVMNPRTAVRMKASRLVT